VTDYSIGALAFLVLTGVGSAIWYIIRFSLDRLFDEDKGLVTRLCNRALEFLDSLDGRMNLVLTRVSENQCQYKSLPSDSSGNTTQDMRESLPLV